MSQLSAQSIRKLCQTTKWMGMFSQTPMITPFIDQKVVVNGKSYGLSGASYDVRIAHDLILGPAPAHVLSNMLQHKKGMPTAGVIEAWSNTINNCPPNYALAHTIEDFHMPHNVVGYVCDKSTYARVFVSAFNTLFDPGFVGNATLELVNLSGETVVIKAGDPICQFTFHWLDKKTDRPYNGKYQNQTKAAHAARYDQ
jgi:deoxycytidine triphosphate deaminase